jgi:hypothetical protein
VAGAFVVAACSGGGTAPLAPQPGAAPQAGAYASQPTASTAAESLAVAVPPVPVAGLDLDLKPLANLTKPIINDSGTFPNGAIIVGTNAGTGGSGLEGISSAGYGVLGLEQNTVAGTYYSGVFGKATGPGSYGVYGYSVKGTGVRGYSADAGSYGGYFSNGAVSGSAIDAVANGLAIQGASTTADGVLGSTKFASGEGGGAFGVEGDDDSTDKGNGDAGVLGTSSFGVGVWGNSPNGWGVEGYSQNGPGLFGQTQSSVACANPGEWAFCTAASPALLLQAPGQSSSPRGMEIIASNGSQDVMSLDAYGNMVLRGSLVVDGEISYGELDGASCIQPPGTCVTPQLGSGRSAPMRAVERVGEAQLVGGHAFVELDASLAKAMDSSQSYHVFVTPEGDCNGLYVTGKTGSGFTVRELHRGTSTLAFDYRIVGTARQAVPPRPPALRMPMPPAHRRTV